MTDVSVLKHPDLPGIEIYLINITPDIASTFLDANAAKQRNLNDEVMSRYREDMKSLDWIFCGTPILFSDKGELIDGQHRLKAIVTSGESQLTLVVAGLSPEALHAIDAGRKRTYGTLLGMKEDRPQHNTQASVIRAWWYWQIGNYGSRGIPRIAVPSEHVHTIPTLSQLEVARKEVEGRLNVTFTAAVRAGQQCYTQYPQITITVWALVWMLLTEYDVDAREGFFHELIVNPVSPDADYPINTLRNRLGRIRKGETVGRTLQLHFVLRAFDAWRSGKRLPTLYAPSVYAWNTLQQPPAPHKGGN